MKKAHKRGEFRRVGTSLYRYQPNKVYYGRFTVDGKEIRVSLDTTNRQVAESTLAKKKKDQARLDTSKSKTTCVKEIFTLAVGDGIISDSPAASIKGKTRETRIRLTPSVEQFEQIVESIRSQELNGHDADESADFVEFLGRAGLGQAEARALMWDDVKWKEEQIVTFRQKTSSGFAVPLYPQVRGLLEKRYEQRENDGRVFKIKDAKKAIAAACERLDFPAFSPRSFRRMFITDAIERGVDVKVLAEWQGHRDGGALILKTYSHVRNVHSQRMAALMAREKSKAAS